jgi:dihydroxyacetone kinase-like predicted kinase
MNAEAPAHENVAAMRSALAAVRSAEVTLAARDTIVGQSPVARGTPIGIVDDQLAVAEATVEGAVRACVSKMGAAAGSVVTLYVGADVTRAAADELAQQLRDEFAADVEVVEGGQPHYPYLVGVE